MTRPFFTLLSCTALLGDVAAQEAGVTVIELRPHPEIPLAYEQTEFAVRIGARISLTLDNQDALTGQPHNFVLLKPGRAEAVGMLATAMITDPKAMEKNYIPDQSLDILAHTPLVQPGESVTIEFIAPLEPGDYPFLCTFPGHWLQMRGTLHVSP